MSRAKRFLMIPLAVVLMVVAVSCVHSARVEGAPCQAYGSANDDHPDWPAGWVLFAAHFDNCTFGSESPYINRWVCNYIRKLDNHHIVAEECSTVDQASRGYTGATAMHCVEGARDYYQVNFYWTYIGSPEVSVRWATAPAFTCPGPGGGGSSGPWAAGVSADSFAMAA